MTEVDENRMDGEKYVQNKADEFGLINVWAYHCYRCNYVWLPKDFDFNWNFNNGETDGYWGHDLFHREPPKACARCKSRSWKIPIALRKRKLHRALEGQKWINEDKINDIGSPFSRWLWINSEARLRALDRQGKLTARDITQI